LHYKIFKKKKLVQNSRIFIDMKNKTLSEMFGEPIGSYAGEPLTGVRGTEPCESCKMMPLEIGGQCGCESQPEEMQPNQDMNVDQPEIDSVDSNVCPNCGMMSMEPGAACPCTLSESKKR